MDQINSSPVSNPVPKSGPKDVFLHLLAIVTLYASVISFIALLWQYVNYQFPDPQNYYITSVTDSIRWSASILVVMFPVYVLVSWLINRGYKIEPARREIRARKWLTYLTLFISALTVIVDVITLVYNLFGGDLTTRFFLKVLVVLITGAAVFGYYLWDLHKDLASTRNVKVLAWVVSILVLGSIVGGFAIVGSPAKQRAINNDNRRVNDLQSLQGQIVYNWQQKGSLPKNLTDLSDSISGYNAPKDPETNLNYEYVVKSNLSFDLCANFTAASVDNNSSKNRSVPAPMSYDPYTQNWTHGMGHTCFTRTIDPQLYKSVPPIK